MRVLCLATVLLFILPAQAAPEEALPLLHAGHPLAAVDPEIWLPVYAQNNSTSDAVDAVTPAGERLYRLGDIAGDARHEVLRIQHFDDSEIRYAVAAIDAAGAVLWEMAIEEGYVYVAGDVDGDGVQDLIRSEGSSGGGPGTVTPVGYEFVVPMEEPIEVLSGADGTTIFQKVLEGSYQTSYTGTSGLPATASHTRSVWSIPMALGRADGLGLDVHTYIMDTERVRAYALLPVAFASASLTQYSYATALERLDATGKSLWSTGRLGEPGDEVFAQYVPDVTGDGEPDVLVQATDAWRYASASAGVFGTSQSLPSTRIEVHLIDGGDGHTRWTHAPDRFMGEGWATVAGDSHGQGAEIALFRIEESPQGLATHIDRLAADDGTLRETRTLGGEFAVYWKYGDADGDGDDEVLLLRARGWEEDDVRMGLAQGDLTPVWEMRFAEPLVAEDPEWWPDLDGDGLGDLLFQDGNAVRGVSGATGTDLWKERWPDLMRWWIAGDINRDGSDELFLLHYTGLDEAVYLETVRGSDGQRLWKKTVWDPQQHAEVEDGPLMGGVANVGDVSGNGIDDIAVHLETPRFMMMVCDDDGCRILDPEGEPLRLALLLEGTDATTLYAFEPLRESAAVADVELGQAGLELVEAAAAAPEEAPLPLLAPLALLAALYLQKRK